MSEKDQLSPEEPPYLWMNGTRIDTIDAIHAASEPLIPPQFPFDGRYAKPEIIKRVARHFESALGKPKYLLHRMQNEVLPLELLVYQKDADSPIIVVTAGLSDHKAAGPRPFKELSILLPPNWVLGQETNSDPLHNWPYTVLRKVAAYTSVSEDAVLEGNMIPWDSPMFPGAKFQDLLVLGFPLTEQYMMSKSSDRPLIETDPNKADPQNTVFIQRLIPIYPDESDFWRKSGPEALMLKQRESGFSWHDLNRPSFLEAPGSGSRPPSPASRAGKAGPVWHRNIDLNNPDLVNTWGQDYAKLETVRTIYQCSKHYGTKVHLFHPGIATEQLRMEFLVYETVGPTVVITAGFSDCKIRDENPTEYVIVLPPGWPIDDVRYLLPQFNWPFKVPHMVALYSKMENKPVGVGNTFNSGDKSFAPRSEMIDWFMFPFGAPFIGKIIVLQMVPIYKEERDYRIKNGDQKFAALLEKEFPEVMMPYGRMAFYDFSRKNVALVGGNADEVNPLAVTALALSIVGIPLGFCCCFLLGPIFSISSVVLGHLALSQKNRHHLTNVCAITALVLGYIEILFHITCLIIDIIVISQNGKNPVTSGTQTGGNPPALVASSVSTNKNANQTNPLENLEQYRKRIIDNYDSLPERDEIDGVPFMTISKFLENEDTLQDRILGINGNCQMGDYYAHGYADQNDKYYSVLVKDTEGKQMTCYILKVTPAGKALKELFSRSEGQDIPLLLYIQVDSNRYEAGDASADLFQFCPEVARPKG